MFKSATFKLTVYYLLIVMAISILFSVVVYAVGSDGIANGIKLQSERIYSEFPVFQANPILKPSIDIERGDHRLLLRLVFFNSVVFIFAGVASYLLAERTLKPIKEAHEQQKRFTSDVSHELRTPLTAIRMEGEVALLNNNLGQKDLRQIIASNLEETVKIENLINGLLRLSRLDSEELQKNFTKIDLNEIVKSAIKTIKPKATTKKIKINEINNIKIEVSGDKNTLTQMIIILLDNAVKYSPPKKNIDITYSQDNHFKILSIQDFGIGINKDDLAHIFDRFYKADSSRNKQKSEESFGIGLSIAKSIAEVHNINIIVSSKVNEGTCVKLVFED